MAYIYDIADTWSGGGAFTGIKLNVTDSGSTAGSLLMDLQVGGVSQFNVDKTGFVAATQTGGNGGGFLAGGSAITFARMYAGQYGVRLASNLPLSWSSGTNLNALDVNLFRDAANTLAQRNGVNAQAFNLYNTYTDASNYERGFMRWVGNALEIGTQAAGTGTGRSMAFQTGGVTRFSVTSNLNEIVFNGDGRISRQSSFGGVVFNADNSITIGAGGAAAILGGYMQVTEMTAPAAPAANGVRIYAEDDGAGKTRLMARFATGAAVQIAIEP